MKPLLAAGLVALTIVLAGCGGGDPSTTGSTAAGSSPASSATSTSAPAPSSPSETVTVTASPQTGSPSTAPGDGEPVWGEAVMVMVTVSDGDNGAGADVDVAVAEQMDRGHTFYCHPGSGQRRPQPGRVNAPKTYNLAVDDHDGDVVAVTVA